MKQRAEHQLTLTHEHTQSCIAMFIFFCRQLRDLCVEYPFPILQRYFTRTSMGTMEDLCGNKKLLLVSLFYLQADKRKKFLEEDFPTMLSYLEKLVSSEGFAMGKEVDHSTPFLKLCLQISSTDCFLYPITIGHRLFRFLLRISVRSYYSHSLLPNINSIAVT